MTTNLKESTVLGNYTQKLSSSNIDWDIADTVKLYDILFSSIAEYIHVIKTKSVTKVLKFENIKGEFLIGAVISYVPNENPDLAGEWEFEFILDSNNIPENAEVVLSTDSGFRHVYFKIADLKYGMNPSNSDQAFYYFTTTLIETLLEWLEVNATENKNETVELIAENCFIAKAEIENDRVKKSITIDPTMKETIKGDADIEVNA